MYNNDLLYQRAAKQVGLTPMLVRRAVTHYFKSIHSSLRLLESPAYYVDFIGTIYTRKSSIEKEMKKLIKLYRQSKKYFYRNPIRNYKILAYVREEIGRLNAIRKQLKAFYLQKKDNRDKRTDKRVVATSLGYYRGSIDSTLAEGKAG